MKSAADLAGAIGWHSRNLHYEPKLPKLSEYLSPPSPAKKKADGNARVLAMMKRFAAEKEAKNGV